MSDKTEEPTPKRLDHARRQGDVPVSATLLQAVGLAVAAILCPSIIQAAADHFQRILRAVLGGVVASFGAQDALRSVVTLTAPFLLSVTCSVVLIGVVQTNALFAPSRVAPDLSRLSPLSFFKSVLSSQRAFAVFRALATATGVTFLVIHRLRQHLPDLAHTTGLIPRAAFVSGALLRTLVRDTALLVLALAVVDVVVTRRAWRSRLRMSKQEVQREQRESEGDPQLKAARERAHQQMLESATLHAVRSATVVVVNPVHLANALRYQEDQDEAPVLLAKGEGEFARKIVEAARAYGIPVVQDVATAHALSTLKAGDEIPPNLYEAVAVILREIQEGAPR